MHNLNKYTKAELISKIKRLDNKNSSPYITKQTILQRLMENLLYFKGLILKLTLFTFLVKTFRKYSLFRRIFTIFNTILITIFGISYLDFYGISIIASFYTEIMFIIGNITTYLTSTHFYSVLSGLFSSKVEIKEATNILRSNNQSSIGNKESSKVSDWFNRQEVIEEESSNKKYYIIAGILLLSCLTWYYYGDDIKPVINTGIDKIKSTIRKRPDNDGNSGNINPSNVNNDLHGNSWSDSLWNLWDKVKNKVRRNDNTNIHSKIERSIKDKSIELIDNTQPIASSSQTKLDDSINIIDKYIDKNKSIDFNNLSQTEIERRGLLEPQLTGLTEIKGDNFQKESGSVINEIYTFLNYHENSRFPKTEIEIGMASLLRDRLVKLANLNNDKYYELLRYNPKFKTKIEKFSEIVNELIPIDSYDEVALSTIKEQDVWSDKANTPSIHSQLLSPINNQNLSPLEKETEDQVLQDDLQAMSNLAIDESKTEEQPKSMLANFLNELDNVGFDGVSYPLTEKYTTVSDEEINRQEATRKSIGEQNLKYDLNQLEATETQVTKKDYKIPKVKTNKSKGIFSNWLDEIKSKRNDSDIIDGTNKELDTKIEQPKVDSDNSIESIDHYLPNPEDIKPNIKIDSPKEELTNVQESNQNIIESPKSTLSTVLDGIKGLFTPKSENKIIEPHEDSNTLNNYPSLSNLQQDTEALFDDDSNNYLDQDNTLKSDIDWNKVTVKVNDDSQRVRINFDETWRNVKNIHFATNNNELLTYGIDLQWLKDHYENEPGAKISKSFNWKDQIKSDYYLQPTVIKEVHIEDLNGNNHSIYKRL